MLRWRPTPMQYAVAVLTAVVIISQGASWLVQAKLTERTDRATEQQREASRRAVCAAVITLERVWQESESPVGQEAARAWHDLRELFQCNGG